MFTIDHMLHNLAGRGSRCLFTVSSICVLCIPCQVERKAPANGLSGISTITPFRIAYLTCTRVSSCSYSPSQHKTGGTMRLKCFLVKLLCSTQYGKMLRVISMLNSYFSYTPSTSCKLWPETIYTGGEPSTLAGKHYSFVQLW